MPVSIRMSNHAPNQIERNAIKDSFIKDIRNLFRLKRKSNVIEDKIIRYIATLFESEAENYFEPLRTSNAFSNNYIKVGLSPSKKNCFYLLQ